MKSLDMETNDITQLVQPAELVMETVTMVTRTIRHEMRKHRPVEISMQQFRALGIVNHHPGASLSVVAAHLGLTTASACKLIDTLVKHELVTRVDSPEDRRKVMLDVTETGQRALGIARKAALGRLAEVFDSLDEADKSAVIRAMDVLRSVSIDKSK